MSDIKIGVSFNVKDLSADEIITTIASHLINIEYGCNMFKPPAERSIEDILWYEDDAVRTIVYQPKVISLIIDNDLIHYGDTKPGVIKIKDIKFAVGMRIYEILTNLFAEDLRIVETQSSKQQHLTKIKKKCIAFNKPLINTSFNVDIIEMTAIQLLNHYHDGYFIVHNFEWAPEGVRYHKNIREFIPWNIITIQHSINEFQTKKHSLNKFNPWQIYKTDEPVIKQEGQFMFRGQRVSKMSGLVHDEGNLIMQNGTLALYPINHEIFWRGDVLRVKVPITFEEVIEDYIRTFEAEVICSQIDAVHEPYADMLKEVIMNVRAGKEPNYPFAKNLREINVPKNLTVFVVEPDRMCHKKYVKQDD